MVRSTFCPFVRLIGIGFPPFSTFGVPYFKAPLKRLLKSSLMASSFFWSSMRCFRAFSWICFVSSMPETMVCQVFSRVSVLMELPEAGGR